MATSLRSHPRRVAILVAAVVAVIVLAALAAKALSGSGTGTDPATAVPANAAAYAWADIHPGGDAGDSVRHVLGHMAGAGNDPSAQLRTVADGALGRLGLEYRRDVKPWVSGRVGVFVTSFGPRFAGAFVAATEDEGKARAALARTGRPYAVAHGVAVVGTAAAVAAAKRAADGASLGTSDRYQTALMSRETPVAALYVDLAHLVDALPASFLGAQRKHDLRLRFARIEDKPVVVTLTGADNRIALDFGPPPAPPDPENPTPIGGGERGSSLLPTRLIYSLPAQSWLAIDVPELGQRLFEALSPEVNPGLPNEQLRAFQHGFARQTGLRPIEDIVSWTGGAAFFAYGPDPARLTAGVVAESLNPDATRHALSLGRRYLARRPGVSVSPLAPGAGGTGFALRLPGLAAPVSVLMRGNRVAVVYGRAGPAAALDAPVKLGRLSAFQTAAAHLGGTLLPSGWLTPARAADFAAAAGAARSPLFRAALPYLRRIAYAQLGIKRAKRRVLIAAR